MRRSRLVVAPVVAASLALAACGSSSTTSSASSSGNSNASSSSTAASAVAAPPTSPPASIPITQPLAKAPPTGKTILYLQCELPACARTTPGIEAGAKALGWKSEVIVYKNSDPGAGLVTAIQKHPDYIAITGIPTAAMRSGLALAKSQHIPVMSCGTTDQPSPGGYAIECGGTLQRDAEYLGRWAARDSGGKANIVAVSIPQFTALVTITDWFKHNFSQVCSSCKFDELDVTVDDVGAGRVASKVVAYLQSHPDTNYVLFTFADLATGSAQAIRAAGLSSKVKLIGAVENASIVQGVPTMYKAWTLSPNEYMGMVMVDAAARLSVGEPLTGQYQTEIYHNPTWILDSAPEAKALSATSNTWPGPTGYVQQFERLWKVGG
jgi:ribose transport system substrate-binding protein